MERLADLLDAQFDPLLARWMRRVAGSLAPARGGPELGHMPALLRRLISTLREPHGRSDIPLGPDGAWEHGAQGFRPGFELEAVVREYGLLVHLVLEVIETTGASVTIRELRQLNDLITNAVAEAAAEYQRRLATTTSVARDRDPVEHVSDRPPAGVPDGTVHLSEANLRTLAMAIPQQVWTAAPDGGLDFVNQRVANYFALTQEEVLGAGWQGVIHPDDLPGCVERWTHSVATGQEYEVEFRLRRADGSYRWHLGRALAVRDAHGAIVKWFGTNTDIDELKKVREELEKRTEFEQHLAGIVSHDLRNPLAVILMGAASLLRMEEQGELTTKIALRIQSSAERSARMISDLLDFTQARLGGGIRLQARPADLYALVATAVDEAEAAYPDRDIALTRAGDTQGTVDADRLGQVVTNLATNALKYSPAGTPVAVHVEGRDGVLELKVHNEGPPIPPERLDRLFAPLQRASDEIDRHTRSLGLGLYIVDSIVRAHGGTVNVQSTEETGTTFTVRLPVGSR